MKRVVCINLLLGIWLLFAPFVLGFAAIANGAAIGNGILGIVLVVTSVWILQASAPPPAVGWFQSLCGIWLVLAPFIRGFRQVTHAMADDVTVGIIITLVALTATYTFAHAHHRTIG
jgi:hypothetical protein